MLTSKLHDPMVPACNVASRHAPRVLYAIRDTDLHVGDTCRDVLIAVIHFAGVESQSSRRRVNQLKDTLCATVAGLWTRCVALITTLNLCDLESAGYPLFAKLLLHHLGDLFNNNSLFLREVGLIRFHKLGSQGLFTPKRTCVFLSG